MLDLIVVGGGPSGLATAILARQRGLSVGVVEARPGTPDKACGEGLMPAAASFLQQRLGVHLQNAHPFRGIRYVADSRSVTADFPAGRVGLGVRRLHLHECLRARAHALGTAFHEARVDQVIQTPEHVEAAGMQARLLIAADGLRSTIRSSLNVDLPPRRPARLGVRQHFATPPWSDHVEVHWSKNAEAYVTPVDPDTVGVAILFTPPIATPAKAPPFNRLLDSFPALAERLGQPVSTVRGAGPFERRVRTRQVGRVLLVGDAAGYLDPITGEGIRLGFDAAAAAVDAATSGQIDQYDRQWRRLARRYWWMTAGLLAVTRSPTARRHLVPLLSRAPRLMSAALNALAG